MFSGPKWPVQLAAVVSRASKNWRCFLGEESYPTMTSRRSGGEDGGDWGGGAAGEGDEEDAWEASGKESPGKDAEAVEAKATIVEIVIDRSGAEGWIRMKTGEELGGGDGNGSQRWEETER